MDEQYRIMGVSFHSGRIQIMRIPEEHLHSPESAIARSRIKIETYETSSEIWYNTFFELCSRHFNRRIDRNEGESVQFASRSRRKE